MKIETESCLYQNLFSNDFKINNINYILIGMILMASINHFIVVFKNFSDNHNLKNLSWFYHDDMNGFIKPLEYLGYENLINSNYFN